MRVLLGLLVDFAWLLYVVCGVAAAVYVFRAISLQRQQGVSYTAFERETTARQIASMWRSAVILVLVGVALAVLQVYMLPQIIPEDLGGPDETPVGVITPTPSPTPTATPQLGALPTITVTAAPPSTPPPSK